MKTVIFIGTQKSGSSREAIRAAERLGYYTVLFTDRPTFWEKRTEFPDVHLMRLCDLSNIEEIKTDIRHLLLKAIEIKAIVSFVDPHCYTACLLAEEFGVNRFSTEGIGNMLNKIISRQKIAQLPYSPRFRVLPDEAAVEAFQSEVEEYLPIIIKSPSSTGSKDVFKVKDTKDLKVFTSKLFKKYPHEAILAEEFLEGPQYLVEVVVDQQQIHIVAIVEQEINCGNRFIVTGYNLVIDPLPAFYDSLKEAVETIVKRHGMEAGGCHLELRYIQGQWKLIEINPRISGGGMNKLMEIGLGLNLVEETLKIALGQEANLKPRYQKPAYVQYAIISQKGILDKVTGQKKASRCPGVKEVYVKPRKGAFLMPPASMGQRYAYVIANGDSEKEAKENAQDAIAKIHFWLSPVSESVSTKEETDKEETDKEKN